MEKKLKKKLSRGNFPLPQTVNVYVVCLMKLDFSWKGPRFHSLSMLVSVNK